MKNLTLQWRIALLTALILAVSSIALTAAAMVNAEHSFMALMEETFSMPPGGCSTHRTVSGGNRCGGRSRRTGSGRQARL